MYEKLFQVFWWQGSLNMLTGNKIHAFIFTDIFMYKSQTRKNNFTFCGLNNSILWKKYITYAPVDIWFNKHKNIILLKFTNGRTEIAKLKLVIACSNNLRVIETQDLHVNYFFSIWHRKPPRKTNLSSNSSCMSYMDMSIK